MSGTANIEALANQEYKYGFVTDIEADATPVGLSEEWRPRRRGMAIETD
jgi:hypothetical protein